MNDGTWTDDMVSELIRMANDGTPSGRIADELTRIFLKKFTRNMVNSKRDRLKLPKGRDVDLPPTTPGDRRTSTSPALVALQRLNKQKQGAKKPTPETDPDEMFGVKKDGLKDLPDEGYGVPILALAVEGCRWPTGNSLFCNKSQVIGLSYCAGHARTAYRPSQRRGPTNKPFARSR